MKSIVFLFTILAAGCASLSAGGQRVPFTENIADVQGCKLLGNVSAPPPYGLPDDWKKKLRNGTADLGGNVVFTEGAPLIGVPSGHAYACSP
jgi:hypothetical protein